MPNFFDENDLVSAAPQKGSFFDEGDLHSDESREPAGQESEQDKISAARAFLVGGGQGVSGGFAEEFTAPFVAAAGLVTENKIPGESTWEQYKRMMQTYRDVAREEQQVAREEEPLAYGGGAVVGGLATMPFLPGIKAASGLGKIAAGATGGAGLGAVYGAGEAEGNIQERLPGTLEGAAIGGFAGGVIPAAVYGAKNLGKATGMIGEIPVVGRTIENIKRGAKGEKLFSSEGRREAADIVREQGGELFKDIKGLQKQVGEQIESKINEASQAGQKVDLTQEVGDVLEKLKVIKAEGSKEAAAYANGVESEIRKLLGLKAPEVADDVSRMAMPEGLSPQALNPNPEIAQEAASILVDPKKAQSLKQVLSDYTPKKGITKPQEIEAAGAAKELRGAASEKLSEVTGLNEPTVIQNTGNLAGSVVEGPSINKQYGILKDTLKRLGVNERRLPTQIKDQIASVLSNLEKETISGDKARVLVDDVLNNIRQVSPEIAEKYTGSLNDAVERLELASKNIGGGGSRGIIGGIGATTGTLGNIAGLGISKAAQIPGVKPIASAVATAGQKTGNFAKNILESAKVNRPIISGSEAAATPSIKAASEPYKLQRQVAQASENAEPDMLNMEAQDIRSKYGKQGEQLATILENMATKDKNARRALMYTVLQNPAHRKMMGLMEKEEE